MLIKEGDLVSIPATSKTYCVGQVAAIAETSFLIATFIPHFMVNGRLPKLEDIDFSSPVFLVETMDEYVESGRWKVLGGRMPLEFPIPAFKVQVGFDVDFYIQNFRGEIGRKASQAEVDRLRTHTSFSPSLVEDAIRAERQLGEWNKIYDRMRADPAQAIEYIF